MLQFKIILNPGADFTTSTYDGGSSGIYVRFPEVYDGALDNVSSILHDISDTLEESSSAEFSVSGFDENWPVDVRTDFCTFLEGLPTAIAAIKSAAPFTIEFYEQGVERIIHFKPEGKNYTAHCTHMWGGKLTPVVETIDSSELLKMLCGIRDDLMNYLEKEAPRIATHPWLVDFFRETAPNRILDSQALTPPITLHNTS